MYRHLLVPIDNSAESTETIGHAVEAARAMGARITFFHARKDVMHSIVGEGPFLYSVDRDFIEWAMGDVRAILAKAQAAARAREVESDALSRVSDHAAEAILDACRNVGCDLILIGTRGRRGLRGLLGGGSITQKLLEASSVPVLVIPPSGKLQSPEMVRAVALIQDEHRSLAVVIHGLQHLASAWRTAGGEPDFRLLRSILHYIHVFPEGQHHPKEEEYLFRLLRQRTPVLDDVIDMLGRQHESDPDIVNEMERHLDDWAAGQTEAGERFCDAAERYAEASWSHMGMEESTILSAAREHLTQGDWVEILQAFDQNDAPSFGEYSAADMQELFRQITNLAPSQAL